MQITKSDKSIGGEKCTFKINNFCVKMSKSMTSLGSPTQVRKRRTFEQLSVNDQFEALKSRDEDLFYNKVSNLLDNIMDRVKRTEDRLCLAEQMKIDKSISGIKDENYSQNMNLKGNPFKMPDLSSISDEPLSQPIPTPKKRLIKKPMKEPTLGEIMDALSLLQMEINDLRENQQDMENQIVQIKKLIE